MYLVIVRPWTSFLIPLIANNPVLKAFQSSNVPFPAAMFPTAPTARPAPASINAFLSTLAELFTSLAVFPNFPAIPTPGSKLIVSNPKFKARLPKSPNWKPSLETSAPNCAKEEP